MTLEMWLDLGAHPTSCFAQFAADRQNPSGVQHGVALQLAWLDISRSTRDVCRLPFCGLSASGGCVGALILLHAVVQACRVGKVGSAWT